jgi:hypothetical protein
MVLTSIIYGIDFADGSWIQDCVCIYSGQLYFILDDGFDDLDLD